MEINLVFTSHTEKTFDKRFSLQKNRCKKVRGVATIRTYKDSEDYYLIEIKPGIAFPRIKSMFDKESLNNKLSLANTFSSEFDNVRVKNINLVTKGYIKKSNGALIGYDNARYYVENKGVVDVFDTLISKIGRKIYVLTRKNAELDKTLFANISNHLN